MLFRLRGPALGSLHSGSTGMSQNQHSALLLDHPASLRVPLIIIVEEEGIVALAMEDAFAAARCHVAEFVSTAPALDWLRTHRPDAAVIDAVHGDSLSSALGAELRQQGIPFLICSALARKDLQLAEFAEVPWLRKPVSFDDLIQQTLAMVTLRGLSCKGG